MRRFAALAPSSLLRGGRASLLGAPLALPPPPALGRWPLALPPLLALRRCSSAAGSGGETSATNILKDGSDPPILPDDAYPDWLWTVHEPLPSLQELTAKFEADPDSMTSVEHRRMTKLWNRARIKDKNAESAKS